MEKKMTKREKFATLLTIVEDRKEETFGECTGADLVEFIEHEMELLARKRSGKSSPTKTQKENEVIKETILSVMTVEDKALRIEEIKALDETLSVLTGQKMSALLKQLVDAGKVERVVDKKVTFFKAII